MIGNIQDLPLTKDNDPSRTEESMAFVARMAGALWAGLSVTRQSQAFNSKGG